MVFPKFSHFCEIFLRFCFISQKMRNFAKKFAKCDRKVSHFLRNVSLVETPNQNQYKVAGLVLSVPSRLVMYILRTVPSIYVLCDRLIQRFLCNRLMGADLKWIFSSIHSFPIPQFSGSHCNVMMQNPEF